MKLSINEQFYSLQGEGPSLGRPANFVRFQGCPLRCHFCDTKYTWKENNLYKLLEEVLDRLDDRANLVVVTGGEPLLYRKEESFLAFLASCSHLGFELEVETCGIFIPPVQLLDYVRRWNVSPKMGWTQVQGTAYSDDNSLYSLYDDSIPWFENVCTFKEFTVSEVIYKFVVSDKDHVFQVKDFVKRYKIKKEQVYLMPEGVSKQDQEVIMFKVAELCKEFGFAMSPRLHSLVWNGVRGT